MDDIFGDIQREGETTDLIEEMETPTDSPTEEKPVVEEPAEEGDNIPLEEDENYKDKTSRRVKQLLAERADERAKREELEQRLAKLENIPQQEEEIPKRWLNLYSSGDPEQDQEAYKEWKTLNQEERAALKAEILEEFRSEQQREIEEQEEKANLYEEQMSELEETLGRTFDHNELAKAMAERPVWTTDGQPDWETKLELLEAKKPASNMEARKKLGTVQKQGSVQAKDYLTPDDLKGMSF